jgi:hypothetical protein
MPNPGLTFQDIERAENPVPQSDRRIDVVIRDGAYNRKNVQSPLR